MRERFLKRYEKAITDYFDYTGDDTGKTVRYNIVREYEKILHEEFDVPLEQLQKLYSEIYWSHGICYEQEG